MPAWKNITLDIPKGDLNEISESISEINRVLSITIIDRIDEPDSKWFDEDGKKQALNGKSHLIKLLTSASVSSNILNKEICLKLDDPSITILTEEQALLNAERNMLLNSADVTFFHSENYNYEKHYDITIANILLNTIIRLKERLISSLKPGGTLILSGILEDQASSIIDTFRNEMTISIIDQDEGWLLMKGQKQT